jgi:RNA polymerase sigma factor (TIGR02999 family)
MENSISTSDPQPARNLFRVVYDELRKQAARQLSKERADHTLNPTALVHEAYLRLMNSMQDAEKEWENRKQFFMAAAEAMRRILVDHARYHRRQKRTGSRQRENIPLEHLAASVPDQKDVVAINDALEVLAVVQPEAAELVKLRYFAGLNLQEAAVILDLAPSTAHRRWAFAKAWLMNQLLRKDKCLES